MEALKECIRCPGPCDGIMHRAVIIPCKARHRTCETCAVLFGCKCPVCKQRYRKRREACLLTTRVAAALFPKEAAELPVESERYAATVLQTQTVENAYRCTHVPRYVERVAEVLAQPSSTWVRCDCVLPDMPGGMVCVPGISRSGRKFVACPAWHTNSRSSGCDFFRFM